MKAQELFERVTADLVVAIGAGAGDWRMPWHRLGAGLPRTIDDRPDRGWKALVLAMVAGERGWSPTRQSETAPVVLDARSPSEPPRVVHESFKHLQVIVA